MLRAVGLRRSFPWGGGWLEVLRGADLEVAAAEIVAVVGPSGSGKSTLLHLLGGLDRPTGGHIYVGGIPLQGLDGDGLARLRGEKVGFIFQFHHLLPDFSSLENVMIPLLLAGRTARHVREESLEMLRAVGLADRWRERPGALSGGEQQRVAVARALIHRPLIVLADEPTGNLDRQTAREVQELLFRLRKERGTAFVIATHNETLACEADRVLRIEDGRLVAARP